MVGSPAEVNLASGHSAAHISTIITVPLTAAARSPIPRIRAMPMPSRPAMNSQSAQAAPAMARKVPSRGPTATRLRKPCGGAAVDPGPGGRGGVAEPEGLVQERPQELDAEQHPEDGEELGGALGDDPPERRFGLGRPFGCRKRTVQPDGFPNGHRWPPLLYASSVAPWGHQGMGPMAPFPRDRLPVR